MNGRKSPKLITSKSGGKLGENPRVVLGLILVPAFEEATSLLLNYDFHDGVSSSVELLPDGGL